LESERATPIIAGEGTAEVLEMFNRSIGRDIPQICGGVQLQC